MRTLMLALILGGTVACDPGYTIHVERGSRADSLVFHAFRIPDSVAGTGGISLGPVRRSPFNGRGSDVSRATS